MKMKRRLQMTIIYNMYSGVLVLKLYYAFNGLVSPQFLHLQ